MNHQLWCLFLDLGLVGFFVFSPLISGTVNSWWCRERNGGQSERKRKRAFLFIPLTFLSFHFVHHSFCYLRTFPNLTAAVWFHSFLSSLCSNRMEWRKTSERRNACFLHIQFNTKKSERMKNTHGSFTSLLSSPRKRRSFKGRQQVLQL